MDDSAPALLVSTPRSEELDAELGRQLPGVPAMFASSGDTGPWPAAGAWLVESPDRELPHWVPEATPRLRFVQRLFTGLDDFPFGRFPPAIEVAGNVGAFAPFVAEHAMTLVLALAHHLTSNVERVRVGSLRPVVGNRYLLRTTALVLGFGAIGHEVAAQLRGFGARVEAVSRVESADAAADRVYAASDLVRALETADVVVECRPLTAATRGSIDRGALERMKPTAIFVNVGRAGTVDEAALFHHLETHPEFLAGTDVWWDEDFDGGRLRSRFPFHDRPNFLGTPHVAGVGARAHQRAIEFAVANLARYFQGERPRGIADRSEYPDRRT